MYLRVKHGVRLHNLFPIERADINIHFKGAGVAFCGTHMYVDKYVQYVHVLLYRIMLSSVLFSSVWSLLLILVSKRYR